MSLINHDQLLQKALLFLTELYINQPNTSITKLIDEVGMRFNLTPLDSLQLMKIFTEKTTNLPIKNS